MSRILVVSPGVLPLPPVMGGAVENLIARLHAGLTGRHQMEYVSVAPPPAYKWNGDMPGAVLHYVESVNPLADFTPDNHFELHESNKWDAYRDYCVQVASDRQPALIHVHNEAYLLPHLRAVAPDAKLLLHVNDEVVTRMRPAQLERLAEACDLILACSGYVGGGIARAFTNTGRRDVPLETYYNFVDTAEYDPNTFTAAERRRVRKQFDLGDGPVVLFVGRMIEQKGPHLALRAFKKIAARHAKARMLFVGAPWYSRENGSAFVDSLRAEAEGLEDRIRFTGYVDHGKMPSIYAAADICCAPSIWDDPSPFVTYEAQAMALPVISSPRGGIPEIVEDRRTGRCLDPFNLPLFASVLDDWLGDAEQRREVGRAGRARVVERFSLERARQRMAEIYKRLCGGR